MTSKRKRFRRFLVAPYLYDALQTLSPPEEMLPSEWAERYRVLDTRDSNRPGPWRNDKTPYLVGIMDSIMDFDIEEVVFCKPTQVGGTEALLNMLGYFIQQDPGDIMIVYPNDDLAERVSENRIRPMIRNSPTLRERFLEGRSKIQELRFRDMSVYLVGANSPGDLSSSPVPRLFVDEADKIPGASKKEADAISLARERTKTFRNSRKIVLASTPTVRTGHIWEALESADEIRHYFVPCPHCGKFIELKWQQVKFPNDEGMSYADRAEFAVYVCQECGGIITDRHKSEMLNAGQWRAVQSRASIVRKVGFWLNTLYSPFVRFSEVVRAFLQSKDDPELLQNFRNSWMAEPWEPTKLRTDPDMVRERQTDLPPLIVPAWAKLLTAGIDVQETCVYWTIRAWGDYITSQNIAHGQALNFGEIERIMNLQYEQEGTGDMFMVSLALMDSGDNTDAVYDFCANNSEWCLPVKGSSKPMLTSFKMSVINRIQSAANGMNLVIVDGGKYKDMIAGRMRRKNGEKTGSWMVHAGIDDDYCSQVTAEHKIQEKTGGRITERWVPKQSRIDNHYLDCEVYAMAAADIKEVRTLHLQEVEEQEQPEPPKELNYTPEESWIRGSGSWIGG